MNKFYTGIGSRSTPGSIRKDINKIAIKLEELGYVLRSGSAEGADTFFEEKISEKEIFIPWFGFGAGGIVPNENEQAHLLLKDIHPAYNKLSSGALKLHLRNINQVLGREIGVSTPSKFLICWAEVDNQGLPKGGTRTAWVLAKKFDIPCFNLNIVEDYEKVIKLIL